MILSVFLWFLCICTFRSVAELKPVAPVQDDLCLLQRTAFQGTNVE